MSLGKPPRLQQVFQKYDSPIYFVTICTDKRRELLANDKVCEALTKYGRLGIKNGVALGRYVVIPDHIHLFVSGGYDFDLGLWIRGLKRVVAAAVSGGRIGFWRRGFFDHLIRNSESYSGKWDYVLKNPVRAGLISSGQAWPFQGEIVTIAHE